MNQERTQVLEDLQAKKTDVDTAARKFHDADNHNQEIDSGKIDIRRLLEVYDFKVLDEQNTTRIQRRLESKNIGDQEEAKAEITARANNVREYMSKLSTGDNVTLIDGSYESIFNTENGANQKQEYIDMFIGLSLREQVEWLMKIDKDITQRIEQFNKLVELVGKNARNDEIRKFKKLRTKDKANYLKKLESTSTTFEQLISSSGLTSTEKREARDYFDKLGLNGRLTEIERLKKVLAPNPKLIEFESANKERRKKYDKFKTLDDSEKEKVLAKIREEIKQEYLDEISKSSYLTREDLRLMRPTVRGRFDIKLAEDCLSFLPLTLELAEKAANEGKKYDVKVLDHFKWDDITSLARQQLLKSGLLEKYANDLDHIKMDQDYSAKLNLYNKEGEFGLITDKAVKEYYKWFQSKNVEEKRKILNNAKNQKGIDYLEDTLTDRRQLNQKFLKLSPQLQKEFKKEYKEGGYEERRALVFMLETEPKKLNQEFEEDIDGLLKKGLVSPNTKRTLLKNFVGMNLSEKIEFKESFEKDNEKRELQADIFKNKVLTLAPEHLRARMKKEFFEAADEKRTKLNIGWLKEFGKLDNLQIREILKEEDEENEDQNIPFETELLLKHGAKAEKEGKTQEALTFYKAILEDEPELSPALISKIKDKIKSLETDLGNYDDEIESGHFEMILDHEIDNILTTNGVLAREQERLTIIQELHHIKWRNELVYKEHPTTEGQMEATLNTEDEMVRDLNDALQEHTQGNKSVIKDAYGDLKVDEEKEFDVDSFTDTETDYQSWRRYVASMQAEPKDKQLDTSIKLIHPKSKHEMYADEYEKQVLRVEHENFAEMLEAPLLKKMGINPKTASEKTLITIREHLRKRDYKKRIPHSKESARN